MVRKLSILSSIIISLSGCAVEELQTTSGQENYDMIKVSMPTDSDTKISLGEETGGLFHQVWDKGDRIAVIEGKDTPEQKVSVYELYGEGGSSEGLFCHISGEADVEGTVDVVYPASAVKREFKVPASQTYFEGTYDPQAVLLSWHGDAGIPENGITLSNESAVVCLQYTGTSDHKVSSVKVKVSVSETEAQEYRVICNDGISLSEEAKAFYICLPEYAQESSVSFEAILSDFSRMQMHSEGKTFLSGNLYRFPPVAFTPDEVLSTYDDNLRQHPRILFPAGYEYKISQMLQSSGGMFLNEIHDQIEAYSDKVMNMGPFLRETLSNVNFPRETLGRVMYLSYMYRMTGEEKYAERAETELLAVAGHYEHWRPTHFLTTSEMSLAFAIGYDWLYDYLPESSKQIFVDEIVNKCLKESETANYKRRNGNWNSVCNACVIASALAVYERIPEEAAAYIAEALEDNKRTMPAFNPDGGYPEGYSYWHYGAAYQAILFEVIKTALGYESELIDTTEGLAGTGAFPMMMATPTGRCFSYADVAMGANVSCASFWFAREYNHPQWLYLDRRMIQNGDLEQDDLLWRFNPCILLFSVGLDVESISRPSENVWFSDGDQPLYVYRSGYDDVNDVYLGVKGGYPKGSHAHMDSGSFYYERESVVWADDLGGDSYTISDYWSNGQDGGRWDIFRLGVSAHNTISFDGANHIVTAKAKITDYFTGDKVGAVVDLTSTCADKVSKAERTVILEGDILNIKDIVVPLSDVQLTWNMVTEAEATVGGDGRLILTSGEKQMALDVVSPSDVQMYVTPAEGGEKDAPNPGHTRVGFTSDLLMGQTCQIHVTLTPMN